MSLTDQEFREAYKPIFIPASFSKDDSLEHQTAFALATIGTGTDEDVIKKLEELSELMVDTELCIQVSHLLSQWYENGLLKGHQENGKVIYNLSKITEANEGSVNPDLLDPGLD